MEAVRIIFVTIALGCLAAAQATSPTTQPDHFDLLVRHGKIVDGSGNAWFYGDVGIRAGKIARIGDLSKATGEREVDATGLIVAPGFIDVHTHADDDLYKLPQAENFIRDGVTSIVVGNCGYGVRDVRTYFETLEKKGVALNVATLIGHNTILKKIKGDKRGALSPEQTAAAK